MRERALKIGSPSPLVGVATEPPEFDSARPALLILNSGVMHHVGTCRLSVKIARRVAAAGLLAVRYDFSGIGDSEARRSREALDEVWRKECSEVMDYLERTRGTSRFVLYGLCSGADTAYHTAIADERVVAFVQIDGYSYTTWRYYLRRYRPVLLDAKRWKRFLQRNLSGLLKRVFPVRQRTIAPACDEFLELPATPRMIPPREEMAGALQRLVQRGVHMYVNFTGGETHYNYSGQYRDTFRDVRFNNLLRLDYYPRANHIITQPEYQQEIVENISSWVLDVAGRTSRLP